MSYPPGSNGNGGADGGPRPANVYDANMAGNMAVIMDNLNRLHAEAGYVEKWIDGIRRNIWGNTKIEDIKKISAQVGMLSTNLPTLDLSGFTDIQKHNETLGYIRKLGGVLSYGNDLSENLVKVFGSTGTLPSIQVTDSRNPYEIPFSSKRQGWLGFFKSWTDTLRPGMSQFQKSIGLLGTYLQDWRDAHVKYGDFVRAYMETRGFVLSFENDALHFDIVNIDDILTDLSYLIMPVVKKGQQLKADEIRAQVVGVTRDIVATRTTTNAVAAAAAQTARAMSGSDGSGLAVPPQASRQN